MSKVTFTFRKLSCLGVGCGDGAACVWGRQRMHYCKAGKLSSGNHLLLELQEMLKTIYLLNKQANNMKMGG